MSKENNNSVKEAIKAYLDDRAKNDEHVFSEVELTED